MLRRRSLVTVMQQWQYWQRVKALFGSSIVAYWPLWEASGTVATDIVNTRNGTYATGGVTLNQNPAINLGAPLLDGTNGLINVHNTALNAVLQSGEFTIGVWFKPSSIAIYRDSSTDFLFKFKVDANNTLDIFKQPSADLLTWRYRAGAGAVSTVGIPGASADWLLAALTVSKSVNQVKGFLNGLQIGATQAASGTWTGNLATTQACLGAEATTPSNTLNGYLAHAFFLNRPATSAEWTSLSRPLKRLSILGDSISAQSATAWVTSVLASRFPKRGWTYNHTAASATITAQLAGQVTASASDNADVIVLHMGTNDDNAGNMATLQTTVETAIDNLRTSNPNATIYCMNVLPRWTDAGGGTPVDKGNIRTAIAAACVAKNVTCWNTFTTPWITAGQTSDGLHPTAAGHAAIAAQILARL